MELSDNPAPTDTSDSPIKKLLHAEQIDTRGKALLGLIIAKLEDGY